MTEKSNAGSYTFTIPNEEPKHNGGYTFLGWATEQNGTAVYKPNNTITLFADAPEKTLYAVWKAANAAPSMPVDREVTGKYVDVVCDTDSNVHEKKGFILGTDGVDFTIGEVKGSAENGYTCTVTIQTAKLVELANRIWKEEHTTQTPAVELVLTYKNEEWVETNTPEIHVKHAVNPNQNPDPDTPPAFNLETDLKDITIPQNLVTCICTTTSERKQYGKLPDGFSTSKVTKEGEFWTVIISVENAVYKAQFDKDTRSTHAPDMNHIVDFTTLIQFKLKYEGNKWVLDGAMPKDKTLHFTCDGNHPTQQPEKPMYPTTDNISGLNDKIVAVLCTNVPAGQQSGKYYGLIDGGFTSTEPKVNPATQKYESTITLNPSAYCSQYSTDTQIPHTVNPNQTTNGLFFVVQYDSSTKKWTPKGDVQTMGIWVKCDKHEIPAPTTDTISGLKEEIVAVVCTNVPAGQQSGKFYGLINGGFTSTEPKFDPATQKYESTITLIPSAYCSQYSTDTQIPHTVNPNQTTNGLSFVVQYDGTTKKWTPKDAVQTMGIWVKCDKHEIPAPTTDTISGLKEEIVAVVCTNVPAGQQSGKYYGLIDGGFTSTEPKVDPATKKYESTITLIPSVYCSQYSTDTQIPHTVNPNQTTEGLSFTVKYHPETKMWMPVEEVKQMGIWVKCDTFTVTFNSDGGTPVPKQELRHGEKVTEPENPTKTGYTFDGWFAPEAEKPFKFNTTITADITLKAKWKANTYRYEIHYLLQAPDGSYVEKEVDKTPTGVFDTTVTITPDANKYGAHYPYNSVKSVVSGVVTVDDPTTILKLYVYYDLDFHTLTFDTMGGSRIAPVKVRHGNAVAKPKDPVNGGYWFDGWYTDKTYRTPYNFATPLTQDTTIYAKWFLIVLPGVTIKKATPKLNTYDHFAYVQGYPDGTVKPAGNITRAETAAILFRLMDNSSRKTYLSTKSGFRDVTASSWYNTYVATLNNAGVITDSANGYFRPNEAITRAELAAMLASFTETTRAANYFNDVSANHWAAKAIAICAKLGWITGYPDGSFRPDRNVTRAELMAMINRATGRAPKSADAFLPGMKTWSDNTADKWYYLDVQEATNSHSYAVSPTELWTALTAAPDWSRYE